MKPAPQFETVAAPSNHTLDNFRTLPMMRATTDPAGEATHGQKTQAAQQGQVPHRPAPVPQPPGTAEKGQGQLPPRSLPAPLGGFRRSGRLKFFSRDK